MTKRAFLAFIVILFVVIGLLPVLSMLVNSVIVDSRFSLEAYEGLLSSRHQWTLMKHSIILSFFVTLLTVMIGVPLGIVLEKTDLPFRRLFAALFVVPLLIPSYILAVSWSDLLGKEGILAHYLGFHIANVATNFLFSFSGCVVILFSIFLPIPMLFTMAFLRTINPELEEAGRLVSGWCGVIRRVSIPLILPGILLSAILVFILSFGEFGVPSFLRYDVFPVESFTQFSAFYNFKTATASAIPLVAVTLVLLIAEAVFLRDRTYQLCSPPEVNRLAVIPLGRHRAWLFAAAATIGFVIVVVPIIVLVIQSSETKIYAEALIRAGDSLLRSVLYAMVGATAITFIGFFTGYLIQTRAFKYWRSIDSMIIFLFALPSTVIGIGLISLWNTTWTSFVYATPLIIILGYIAKYTALASRISVTQLAQIPPSMEEAAQIVGGRWFYRMVFIVAPLARRALLTAWIVGYIFSLRDIGITMLVYPAGCETLPVRILTLMANGSPQLIAALCIVMMTATLLPAGVLWMMSNVMMKKKAG